MRVISVNVGTPQSFEWGGTRLTSIFKAPVAGPVAVRRLNLDGDRQSDLTVHGGPEKAVYGYAGEHYAYWQEWSHADTLPIPAFGENLTTEGLLEDEMYIGDRYRVGTALLEVTQPRMPCYKLGVRHGTQDIVAAFLKSGFSGFYFRVLEEGDVAAGDSISREHRPTGSVAVTDIVRIDQDPRDHRDLLERALQVDALAQFWRDRFQQRLARG